MIKTYFCSRCGYGLATCEGEFTCYSMSCPLCGNYMTGSLQNETGGFEMGHEGYKKEVEFNEDPNVRLHADICRELNELYKRKNHDYGDSFHQTYLEEGMAMPRIRLADKFNRFKSLTRGEKQSVTDESIRDTLIDLANYAIMTVMEMDREKEGT